MLFYGLVDLSSTIIYFIIFNHVSIFKYPFGDINFKNILVQLYMLIFFCIINYIYYRTISELSVIFGEIFNIILLFMDSIMDILISKNALSFYQWFLTILAGILVLFSSFIYIEIIELNFCGLNKNTRRNILKRVIEENLELDDFKNDELKTDNIEISKGYLVELGFNQQLEDYNL